MFAFYFIFDFPVTTLPNVALVLIILFASLIQKNCIPNFRDAASDSLNGQLCLFFF